MKTQAEMRELTQILEETPRGVLNVIKKDSSGISDQAKQLALRTFVFDGVTLLHRRDTFSVLGLKLTKTYHPYSYSTHEELIRLGVAETYRTTFNGGFYTSKETWLRLKDGLGRDGEPTPKQYLAYWSQN